MNLTFHTPYILTLLEKLENNNILPEEHSYLQKIFSAQVVINQHYAMSKSNPIVKNQHNSKALQEFCPLVKRYYTWLTAHWNQAEFHKREKTDLLLLKCSLERMHLPTVNREEINLAPPISNFELLRSLATIWERPLQKERSSVIAFLSFFMEKAYNIPRHLIEKIFTLLHAPWKLALPPLGSITEQKFSLAEIESYFFGENVKPEFSLHVVEKIDRLFSIAGKKHKNHIFVPKIDDFDVFNAALVVHEFQHIIDAIQDTNESLDQKNEAFYTKSISDDPFLFEKKALQAEKIFFLSLKTDKRKKYGWLESNLFYPIILLQCELENLLASETDIVDFEDLCQEHQMEPVPLSSLFEWGAPFQMSLYCAAAMDLERTWMNYIQ